MIENSFIEIQNRISYAVFWIGVRLLVVDIGGGGHKMYHNQCISFLLLKVHQCV